MGLSTLLRIDATSIEMALSVVLLSLSVAACFQEHIFKKGITNDKPNNKAADGSSEKMEGPSEKKNESSENKDGSSEKKGDDTQNKPASDEQQPAWVTQTRIRLLQALLTLCLLDLGVVGLRTAQAASIDHKAIRSLASTVLALIAYHIQSTLLQSEAKPSNAQGPRWFAFLPCWVSLFSASISIFPLFCQAGTFVFAEKQSSGPASAVKVDDLWKFSSSITGNDVLQRVLLGSLVVRFCLLCILGLLSAGIVSGVLDVDALRLPANLFQDPLATSAGPQLELFPALSVIDEEKKDKDKSEDDKETAEEKKKGMKAIVRNTIFVLRMTYPSGILSLKILYFVKIGIMLLGRIIVFYTPFQTERIMRAFASTGQGAHGNPVLSKFDMASIVSYVFYDYLTRYSNILNSINQIITSPLDDHARNSMTLRFFEHVHGLSMAYHLDTKSGETMQTISSGESAVIQVGQILLRYVIPNALDAIVSIAYFWFAWGWKYGLLIVINMVFYIIIHKLVSKRQADTWTDFYDYSGKASSRATDSLQNFETVKHFTNERYEVQRYREGLSKYAEKGLRAMVENRLLSMPEDFLWSWNLFVGCVLCASEIAQGKRDASSFMTFVLHAKQLEGPVDTFGWIFSWLLREYRSIDRLIKIIELEPTVRDIPNAPPLVSKGGDIEFENVSFQYNADKKGLSNLSFKVPQGSTVGIVGPTGSGKSTLLRLLFRFWDPSSGRILIDGQDISKVTQQSVRAQIGVVPQDTSLMDESILYNIGYARPSATRAEIEEAAKAAQIHDSIMNFDKGYDTAVGERGAKLSGGERQRIGIARVVLKRPSIVLLDEATSALDSATESEIQKALYAVTENRTTFVVAHRLSTVMHADLILCIKDGKIVERGTHEELVQRAIDNGGKGEYYRMWRIQSGENLSSNASTVGDDEPSATTDQPITPDTAAKAD